jgi:hypothetical protein
LSVLPPSDNSIAVNNNDDTRRQKCRAKGSGKEVKIQQVRYRDITNVEPEMYSYTCYNWSHWNCDEKLKGKSGRYTEKTFDRFTTADSCTGNSTHITESAAVWDWSVSGGGHRWFKGSTRKEFCDKR